MSLSVVTAEGVVKMVIPLAAIGGGTPVLYYNLLATGQGGKTATLPCVAYGKEALHQSKILCPNTLLFLKGEIQMRPGRSIEVVTHNVVPFLGANWPNGAPDKRRPASEAIAARGARVVLVGKLDGPLHRYRVGIQDVLRFNILCAHAHHPPRVPCALYGTLVEKTATSLKSSQQVIIDGSLRTIFLDGKPLLHVMVDSLRIATEDIA